MKIHQKSYITLKWASWASLHGPGAMDDIGVVMFNFPAARLVEFTLVIFIIDRTA